MKKLLLLTIGVLALSTHANAEVRRIISPNFKSGKFEAEYYGAKDPLEGNSSQIQHLFGLGYGISSWLQAKVEGRLSENSDETPDQINLVGRIQFWSKGSMPFDLGLRAAYEMARESNVNSRFVGTVAGSGDISSVKTTLNFIVAQDAEGEDDKLKAEGAAQMKTSIGKDSFLGVEYYGVYGDLSNFSDKPQHLLGPMLETKIPGLDVNLAGAFLFGVTDTSPDMSARWEARYEF